MSIWGGMKTKKEKELRRSYWLDADTTETWINEDCNLKESSKPGYRKAVQRFGGYLENKGITTATKKDAEDFLNLYAVTNGDGAAYNLSRILAKYSRWLFNTHRVGEDVFLDLELNFTYKSATKERVMKRAESDAQDTYTLAELAELLLKLNEYSKEDVLKILEG